MALLPLPLVARRVFVDSSAHLALLDRDDEHHDEAISIVTRLARERYRLFTTNVILVESHALILSCLGNRHASQFLLDIRRSSTTVVRIRAGDEERALESLLRYSDKDFSFADATSFVVMERLGITSAFTFDRDFAQYGFQVVSP